VHSLISLFNSEMTIQYNGGGNNRYWY
jgi:hypothetical protein